MKRLARIGLGLLGVFALLGVVGFVLLRSGQLSLEWARPFLEARIDEAADGVAVTFAAPRLVWSGMGHSPALRVSDLEVRPSHGPSQRDAVLSAGELDVGIAVGASLRERRLVLADVALLRPVLRLGRAPSDPAASASGPLDGKPAAGLARALASLTKPAGEGSLAIASLRFSDGRLMLGPVGSERALDIAEGIVDLEPEARSGLAGRLSLAGGTVVVTATPVADAAFALKLEAASIVPATILEALVPAAAAYGRMPWGGTAETRLGVDGALDPVRLAASIAAGQTVPAGVLAEPLAIGEAHLSGAWLPAEGRLTVDQAVIEQGATRLEGTADIRLAPATHVAVRATAARIDRASLAALWPLALAPRGRAWVAENLTAGTVEQAVATLDWSPGQTTDPTLTVAFDITDAATRLPGSLPPLEAAHGRGVLTLDELKLDIAGGRLGELGIEPSKVAIDFAPGTPDRLSVQASLRGPAAAALRMLERAPGGIAARLPVKPEQVRGEGAYRIGLGLPLDDSIAADEVEVSANVDLDNAAILGIDGWLDIADADLTIEVDSTRLGAKGIARLNGVLVHVQEASAILQGAEAGVRTAKLHAEPDRIELSVAGLPNGLVTGGRLPIALEVRESSGHGLTVSVRADLTPAALDLRPLAYAKSEGAVGSISAQFHVRGERVDLQQLAAHAPDFALTVSGSLQRDGGSGVAQIEQLKWGSSELTGKIERQQDGKLVASVAADRVDLATTLPHGFSSGSGTEIPPLSLAARIGDLRLPGGSLRSVDLAVEREPGAWRSLTGTALLASGTPLVVSFADPVGPDSHLKVTTDDAGSLFGLLDPEANFAAGGRLRLSGAVTRPDPLVLEGHVVVRDFSVRQAPLLARVLTLTSLTGILDTLSQRGISFRRARADLRLGDGALAIDKGRAHGSDLGLTVAGTIGIATDRLALSGTVVPFYTVNHLLSRIPIVGQLLAGREGTGAFAATWAISGRRSRPEFSVNPLSLIIPGAIRDLFADLSPGEEQELNAPAGQ